jgi:hypothetical protein
VKGANETRKNFPNFHIAPDETLPGHLFLDSKHFTDSSILSLPESK